VHDFRILFGFEDAVVENLFSVSKVHCDRYECKILNVKLAVKYSSDQGEKKTVRP